MDDILKLERLNDHSPISKAILPEQIFTEVKDWIEECKKIKDHPLAELKAHENVGYKTMDGKKHNSYQVSIPPRLVEESFWLPWVLRLVAKYYGGGKSDRLFKLRSWRGHYDAYGIWANFAYKGDDNPPHHHPGFISGNMYIQNDGHPTIFRDYNTQYEGEEGTMILWPSKDAVHQVEEKTTTKERITISFNIIQLPNEVTEEI